jgi:hypothetical protein
MQNSGIIIEYTRKDGSLTKGLVTNRDQCAMLMKNRKVVVTLLNDDLTVKLDSTEKPMKVLSSVTGAKTIGFID